MSTFGIKTTVKRFYTNIQKDQDRNFEIFYT